MADPTPSGDPAPDADSGAESQPVGPGQPFDPAQPIYPGQPVPTPAGYGYWLPPGYLDPHDPLVTPPGAGIGGWWERCWSVAQRSWQQLLSIALLTQVLPMVAISLAALPFQPELPVLEPTGEPAPGDGNAFIGEIFVFLGVVFAVSLVVSLVQSLGWGAAVWVITQHASGGEASLGAAFRYGLRRAPGLWGWYLLSSLIIAAGICACVLPAFYLALAVSLAGPIYLFERRNPIGRSFQMVHAHFGVVLGRVAIVVVVVLGGTLVVAVGESLGMGVLGIGVTPGEAFGFSVGYVVITVLAAVLSTPFQLAQIVGILLTYTEQRGREAPVNSARLAAELS